MAQWFKMYEGTVTDTVFGIISKKVKINRGIVLAAWLFLMDSASKSARRGVVTAGAEDLAFLLEISEEAAEEILVELKNRGRITDNFITGWQEMQGMSDAERKRKSREKNVTDKSQNVTDSHGQSQDVTPREREREKERRERKNTSLPSPSVLKPPLPPLAAAGQGSGSFQQVGGLVGSVGGRGFDIEQHLQDDDYIDIASIAPDWSKQMLFSKYNAFVANDPPRSPRPAFLAWLRKFTKGKRP